MMDDLLAIGMAVRSTVDIPIQLFEIEERQDSIPAGTPGFIVGEFVQSTGIHYSVEFGDHTVVGCKADEIKLLLWEEGNRDNG